MEKCLNCDEDTLEIVFSREGQLKNGCTDKFEVYWCSCCGYKELITFDSEERKGGQRVEKEACNI